MKVVIIWPVNATFNFATNAVESTWNANVEKDMQIWNKSEGHSMNKNYEKSSKRSKSRRREGRRSWDRNRNDRCKKDMKERDKLPKEN